VLDHFRKEAQSTSGGGLHRLLVVAQRRTITAAARCPGVGLIAVCGFEPGTPYKHRLLERLPNVHIGQFIQDGF